MLFRAAQWEGIADGSITVAFRCWRRPAVKVGGTQRTHMGVLQWDAVDEVARTDVTADEIRAAGGETIDDVVPPPCEEGRRLYRIRFHRAGEDPRIALRAAGDLDDDERARIDQRLDAMDRRSGDGPWTRQALRLIGANEGVVSTDLAPQLGMDRQPFKLRVRKLKELGLTESLEVGYRLSPRGQAYVAGLAEGRRRIPPPGRPKT